MAALFGLAAGVALGVKLGQGRVEYIKVPAAPVPCKDCDEKKAEALRVSRVMADDAVGEDIDPHASAPAVSENGVKEFSHQAVAPAESSLPDSDDIGGAMARARSHASA